MLFTASIIVEFRSLFTTRDGRLNSYTNVRRQISANNNAYSRERNVRDAMQPHARRRFYRLAANAAQTPPARFSFWETGKQGKKPTGRTQSKITSVRRRKSDVQRAADAKRLVDGRHRERRRRRNALNQPRTRRIVQHLIC
jgi:hypothetical protein